MWEEGQEGGLSTWREVLVGFGLSLGREGKGSRECCFYAQQSREQKCGGLGWVIKVTQPVAELISGPMTFT